MCGLDHCYVLLLQSSDMPPLIVVAVICSAAAAWVGCRRRVDGILLLRSAGTGVVLAAAAGAYMFGRVTATTVSSKPLELNLLAPLVLFVIFASGAFIYLQAASVRGRALGLLVATVQAWAPAVFTLVVLTAVNMAASRQIGGTLYNYHSVGLEIIAFCTTMLVFWAVVTRTWKSASRTKEGDDIIGSGKPS